MIHSLEKVPIALKEVLGGETQGKRKKRRFPVVRFGVRSSRYEEKATDLIRVEAGPG